MTNGFDNEDEYVAERGKYKSNQCLDYDTLWYNPTMDFPIEYDGETYYPGGSYEQHKARHSGEHNPKDWVWRWSKAKFDFGVKNGFVEFKKGRDRTRIYTKTYENASIGKDKNGDYFVEIIDREKKLSSLGLIENENSNDNGKKELDNIFGYAIFDNPKPSKLIQTLLSVIDNENAIVLDFFAGSGTTGHSVFQANKNDEGNRIVILCTNNEITNTTPNGIAYDVTAKRMKRIMTGECYDKTNDFEWLNNNAPFGGSLDVYEIESVANFNTVEGETPFDVIDETLYGHDKFTDVNDKIKWVCENFDRTQKYIENDDEYQKRIKEERNATRSN